MVLFVCALTDNADADPAECQDAINSYNATISDVSEALRSYASCVDDSHAHDDCSAEFATIQSAQGDFEDAVTAYESDCQ
jgi:hypothetical protein